MESPGLAEYCGLGGKPGGERGDLGDGEESAVPVSGAVKVLAVCAEECGQQELTEQDWELLLLGKQEHSVHLPSAEPPSCQGRPLVIILGVA